MSGAFLVKSFTLARTFEVPTSRLWAAWSEPELVRQWWGPVGFTCPVAQMDLRKGGVSLVCMEGPGGMPRMFSTWTYVRVEPERLFDYRFNLSDETGNAIDPSAMGMPPDFPRNALHQVRINAIDGGRSELVMTEHGYVTDELMELSEMGLSQCFDKMAAALGA